MKRENLPYLVFGAPHLGHLEISEVTRTLRSGWIGTGPKASIFEAALEKTVRAPHVRAVNSCTAALHLSLLTSGIKSGDEVITTPLTFAATSNAIIHAGATPVFVDVNRQTMNIDETKIAAAITKRTKAILPVHLYGRPCEMDVISGAARKHKLTVIEDAAHAIGAKYRGRPIGSISPFTCFSFYVTKNVTTGEGGAVACRNLGHAERIRTLGLHGMTRDAWKRFSKEGYKHYDVVEPGYKYNMTDIQASLGIHQLASFEQNQEKRTKIWGQYLTAFADLPIELPVTTPKHMQHAHHLFTILVDRKKSGTSRDAVMNSLHRDGIGSGVHYLPVHLHSYYRKRYGYRVGDYPNAEYIGATTLSLPLSPSMREGDVARVIQSVRKALGFSR